MDTKPIHNAADRRFMRQIDAFLDAFDGRVARELDTDFDFSQGRRAYCTIESGATGRRHVLPIFGKPDGSIVICLTDGAQRWLSGAGLRRFVIVADQREVSRATRKPPVKIRRPL